MTVDKKDRLKMAIYKHTGQGHGMRRAKGNGLEPRIGYRLDTHTDREYELKRELKKKASLKMESFSKQKSDCLKKDRL